MAQTMIRGSTQLLDDSVTAAKLDPDTRAYIQQRWTEVKFEATAGQTAFSLPLLQGAEQVEVYRNGLLEQPEEYTVSAGQVQFETPMLAGEQVSVFYGLRIAASSNPKLGVDP